mmetsp:Transcript_29288/g.73115  ORF Transcript_29288/g.73115 Transcript_29288/m.73115 type:complete len:506 (-) Transcript_29288:48-1565(-)
MLAAIEADNAGTLLQLVTSGSDVNELQDWDSGGALILLRPLHLGAHRAAVSSVEVLLAHGAQVNLLDARGWTCLHYLAVSNADSDRKTRVLQALRRAGADADWPTPTQQIPLHFAARAVAEEPFLSHLLLATRDPGANDVAGRTSLHYVALAAERSVEDVACSGYDGAAVSAITEDMQVRVAAFLLRFRAVDPRAPDAQRLTAADIAAARNRLELAGLLRRAEVPRSCIGSRWFMPLVFCLLLGAAHVAGLFFVLPLIPSILPSILLGLALVSTACAGFSAGFRDPGYLKSNFNAGTLPAGIDPGSFCYSCQHVKVLRSKHCRSCNKCVREFDHHCPWLNNCIGKTNRTSFYVFISALLIDVGSLGALSLASVLRENSRRAAPDGWVCSLVTEVCSSCNTHYGLGQSVRWVVLACCIICFVQIGAFWFFRTRNLLRNLTTNEVHNYKRYAHFKTDDGGFRNPFDRGVCANCHAYFCSHEEERENVLALLEEVTARSALSSTRGTI